MYEIRDLGAARSTAYRIKDRLEAAGEAEIVTGRVFRVSSTRSPSTSVSALEIVEDRQPTTIDLP